MDENEKICNLADLQEKLDFIRGNDERTINFVNVIDCLFNEIRSLNKKIEYLVDLVPIKYKKAFPAEGENPFFSKSDFRTDDPQEYEKAKIRMAALLKPANEEAFSTPWASTPASP